MHLTGGTDFVEATVEDLENRTLNSIQGDFTRLIYLASMRDYNTGRYHHEGLARVFTVEAAEAALAICHRRVFERLALRSIEDLLYEIQAYVASSRTCAPELLANWQALEPYRVTVPLASDPLQAAVFCSNIRIALAVLESQPPAN